MQSLCLTCRYVRVIVSGKGSRFVLCQKSQEDGRFAKYPPQPVVRCAGYVKAARSAPLDSPATRDGSSQHNQADAH